MPPGRTSRALAALLIAFAALPAAGEAGAPPVIPREVLFGNPERTMPTISPDGARLAWLAPDERNVEQVFVQVIGEPKSKAVTADRKRGIRNYLWAEDDRTLLYLQDVEGDENFHLYGVDLDTHNIRDFTPFQGVRVEQVWVSPKIPDSIFVSLNLRDRRLFDVYAVDLRTGAVSLDTENPGDVVRWTATDDLEVRAAEAEMPDGSTEIRYRRSPSAAFTVLAKAPFGDELRCLDFTADGRRVYLRSSAGANTVRVVSKDLLSGAERVVAQNADVDAGPVQLHPRRHVVEAVDFPAGRQSWTIVDATVKADFEGLRRLSGGDFTVVSRDRADKTWIVSFNEDKGSRRFYSWDRAARKGTLLFVQQPRLEGLALAPMKPVTFESRDGLVVHGYLTLPVGAPPKGLPLVLFVHGGPWHRDAWGFNPTVQWLANRGYAVLQVNFRGSTGYGKKFLNAGNKQWGKKMHEDLVDAVRWAVKEGYADPAKVAVYGGSYGGYAALAGVAFTPEVFRCAVDLVGPSNLLTLLASLPPYWEPLRAQFHQRVGDPKKDDTLLFEASPLHKAEAIKAPVLIGQGANDPRVKVAESEQIVAAIQKNGGAVTYVLYPDEGHGFARPENRVDFTSRAEAFLAECLGGRLEPLQGERIPGSSAQVKVVKAKATQP